MNQTALRRRNPASLLILLTAVLLLLTGCVRTGIGVVIGDSGSGTVEISVGLRDDLFWSLTEEETEAFLNGKTPSTLTEGDRTYLCTMEHRDFQTLEELQQILTELEYDSSALKLLKLAESTDPDETPEAADCRIFQSAEVTHTADFFGDTFRFRAVTLPHSPAEFGEWTVPEMDGENLPELVVAVTMPGSVISEKDEIHDSTVTFRVSDLETEQTLEAESTTPNITSMVIVGVAVLIFIIILALLLHRRKPANHEFD